MGEARHPNHPGELSTEAAAAERMRDGDELGARARAIQVLQRAGVPFLVGGAYAYATYTGIYRDTKDLDLFLRKRDAERALEVLDADGWRTERTDEVLALQGLQGRVLRRPHLQLRATASPWWTTSGSSTRSTGRVFGHDGPAGARRGDDLVQGASSWSASGSTAPTWTTSSARRGRSWTGTGCCAASIATGRCCSAHLMLFRFAYPSDRDVVPDWVMTELLSRTVETLRDGRWEERLCRGNSLDG